MRITMLAHRLPYPPRTGDKVRAYHVARHLARRHQLTLCCLADEPDPEAAAAALRRDVPDLAWAPIQPRVRRLWALASLAFGRSATIAYFDSPALRRRVAVSTGGRADLVYVSSSSMAQFASGERGTPVVIDFVDVDSDKWAQYGTTMPAYRAWVYRLEARRLRAHEIAAARRAACCLVTTDHEAAILRSFAPWAAITVVPNGVDLEYFAPAPVPPAEPIVVFTGAMDYFPNVDAITHFCREAYPRLRARVSDVRLLIVGRKPVAAVRRLAELPGVEVTGSVPDVRPYLRRAAVAVAPLRVARGIQNKVLEAMAMGLPVVTSTKAHEGLEARPGTDLFVEDDPARVADLVGRLLGAPAERAVVGQAARRFVESHHGWEVAMAKVDRVLAEATGRGSRARLAPAG